MRMWLVALVLCFAGLSGCKGGDDPVPQPTFVELSGVNLPWENYGHDVGLAHTWDAGHDGFSSNTVKLQADLAFAAQNQVKLVRFFVFCDLRGGVIFDGNGNPVSFDQYVIADFEAILNQAAAYNIQLIPVLLDFRVADGVSQEGQTNVGEHPDLIMDAAKRAAWLALLRQFVGRYRTNQTVFAWEVINEPEFATAVTPIEMKNFVTETALAIHEEVPGSLVTVGCRNRGDLTNWIGTGLDIYQFHYYDVMEGQFPLDFPAANLNLDKPVLVGEIQPTNVTAKLTTLQQNGYAGALFWSLNADYDFRGAAEEYTAWMASH